MRMKHLTIDDMIELDRENEIPDYFDWDDEIPENIQKRMEVKWNKKK